MSDPSTAPILVEREDGVVTLILNRPDRLNAVNRTLYERLVSALDELEADDAVRAIVLTGAGRAFCSGADLKEHGGGDSRTDRERYVELGQSAHRRLQTIPKPVVAAVNGAAVGAGVELALACDLIVVADDAKIRFPEVTIGTVIGGGATFTLAERGGASRARELLYLGEFIDGARAAEIGLANRAVPAADVLPIAIGWARKLADRSTGAIGHVKRLLDGARASDADDALAAEAEALLACMESEEWDAGKRAFDEGRSDPPEP